MGKNRDSLESTTYKNEASFAPMKIMNSVVVAAARLFGIQITVAVQVVDPLMISFPFNDSQCAGEVDSPREQMRMLWFCDSFSSLQDPELYQPRKICFFNDDIVFDFPTDLPVTRPLLTRR